MDGTFNTQGKAETHVISLLENPKENATLGMAV
jgi:hypothetical protein